MRCVCLSSTQNRPLTVHTDYSQSRVWHVTEKPSAGAAAGALKDIPGREYGRAGAEYTEAMGGRYIDIGQAAVAYRLTLSLAMWFAIGLIAVFVALLHTIICPPILKPIAVGRSYGQYHGKWTSVNCVRFATALLVI